MPTVYWVVRRPPAAGRVAEDSFLSPKLVDQVFDESTPLNTELDIAVLMV